MLWLAFSRFQDFILRHENSQKWAKIAKCTTSTFIYVKITLFLKLSSWENNNNWVFRWIWKKVILSYLAQQSCHFFQRRYKRGQKSWVHWLRCYWSFCGSIATSLFARKVTFFPILNGRKGSWKKRTKSAERTTFFEAKLFFLPFYMMNKKRETKMFKKVSKNLNYSILL